MQKAASAYEAREKICGKASCMACSRTQITARLEGRGPQGRETLPAQTKQGDVSDHWGNRQEKYSKEGGMWELNPHLTCAAINSDFAVRDFCLVISKEMLNRTCQLCLQNTMCVAGQRRQWKYFKRKNFKQKRITAEYRLRSSSTKQETIFFKSNSDLQISSKISGEQKVINRSLKQPGQCTSLETGVWHCLTQKRHCAALLLITT